MQLTFLVLGEILEVKVDPTTKGGRALWMRGRMTNGSWLPFEELVKLSKQDNEDVRIVQAIVRDLEEEQTLEAYIRREFQRQGMIYQGTTW